MKLIKDKQYYVNISVTYEADHTKKDNLLVKMTYIDTFAESYHIFIIEEEAYKRFGQTYSYVKQYYEAGAYRAIEEYYFSKRKTALPIDTTQKQFHITILENDINYLDPFLGIIDELNEEIESQQDYIKVNSFPLLDDMLKKGIPPGDITMMIGDVHYSRKGKKGTL